ncbi:MAG TPA: hypothetical protein VGA81_03370 [Methylomirabilota bacterium]
MTQWWLAGILFFLGAAGPATAQVSVSIGVPSIDIGIHLPALPALTLVPGSPVYYAPSVDGNFFFYDGMYWVYQNDNWYSSSWYSGPWALVDPEIVPPFILQVPVRYSVGPQRIFTVGRRALRRGGPSTGAPPGPRSIGAGIKGTALTCRPPLPCRPTSASTAGSGTRPCSSSPPSTPGTTSTSHASRWSDSTTSSTRRLRHAITWHTDPRRARSTRSDAVPYHIEGDDGWLEG